MEIIISMIVGGLAIGYFAIKAMIAIIERAENEDKEK